MLIATTAIALAVAFDLHGAILSVVIAVFVPLLVVSVCFYSVYRFQMFTANLLTPFFYSRGIFAVLRWTCGRRYSAWALCNYAARLSANARYNTAIEAYTRVLAYDDSSADYWAHRGAAHYNAGNLHDAESDLTQALRINPHREVALAYRGFTRMSLGKHREAIDDLDQIRCEESNHSLTAFYRGHAHELLGEWHAAIDDYLLAHELDPSETTAAISLARLQAGCPLDDIRNGSKAVDNAFRMCVRTEWKDWIAVSILAAAHAEEGNFEAAVQYAKQTLELAPEEERRKRQQRIEQFQNRKPFRISETGRVDPSRMEKDATEPIG
ncbi:MAG TPA: tetratricopeptide repeat protein [Pirellulaceae bacterium]|nr:tetratricopeptide repeat protein [Pirellulaceae bacterium]